jgi:hypothetical protein
MSTQTIDLNGATETITVDENGASLMVISANGVGGGQLVLAHDANNSTIDALYNSLTIDQDANCSTLSVLAGTFDVLGNANNAHLTATDGVMMVKGDVNGTTVDLNTSHFIDITDEANNVTFDYISGVSTVELSHAEHGQFFENLNLGDHIELATAFNSASVSCDQHTLSLFENGHEVADLHVSFAPGSPENFFFGIDKNTGLYFLQIIPCFAAGTRIMTTHGEIAVEELRVGDLVVTLSGKGAACKPVRWIGERRIDIATHPRPDLVRPVRIAAGAFGDRLPMRDLVVSPDHSLAIDGVLINAGKLVNGVSIAPDLTARAVRYFHVELERHDVLLAEGMPAESYLDTGNRHQFGNGRPIVALHPDFAPKQMQTHACLPFVEDGPILAAVRARLIARLEGQGYTASAEPNLVLVVNERVLRPSAIDGQTYRFALPERVAEARLASRVGFPSGTVAGEADCRRLGVCVTGLAVCRGDTLTPIRLDDPALAGFHPVESNGMQSWRWTDGDAALPAAALAGGGTLEIRLLWPGSYWTLPEVEERVALRA